MIPAYEVMIRPSPVLADTLEQATVVLLRATKADPTCTYMPFVRHGDGSALTEAEVSAQDRIMDAVDYGALEPWHTRDPATPPCPSIEYLRARARALDPDDDAWDPRWPDPAPVRQPRSPGRVLAEASALLVLALGMFGILWMLPSLAVGAP
jgi:hypothetical protein